MVCHCIGNERVLLAFVHQGCITFAKDILIGEHPRMVSGSQPCLSLAKNVRSDALWMALSRLLVCCAKMHGVAMFHAAAVTAFHLFIASVRNCRIVLREIRWR